MKKSKETFEDRVLEAHRENKALGVKEVYSTPSGSSTVRTTLSVERFGGLFALVEFKIQEDRVLSIEVDEPTSKAIAIDAFKCRAQVAFLD